METMYQIFWKDHALERLVDWSTARNIVSYHMTTHATDPVWMVPVTDYAELQRMLKHVWLHQHGAPPAIRDLASVCASLDELWQRSNLAFLLWLAQRVLSRGERHKLAACFACKTISYNIQFEPGRRRQMWMSYLSDADPRRLDAVSEHEFKWTDADTEELQRQCTEPGHHCVARAITAVIQADASEAAFAARESMLSLAAQLPEHTEEKGEDALSNFNAWGCTHIRGNYTPNWLLPPAGTVGVK